MIGQSKLQFVKHENLKNTVEDGIQQSAHGGAQSVNPVFASSRLLLRRRAQPIPNMERGT